MKFRFFLLLALFIAGCSSSEPEKMHHQYPNLTQLNPPETESYQSAKVYIDSVKIVQDDDQNKLLISGNFADGCTKLKSASHSMQRDSLDITLDAWKPSDKMCTQALVPFSFMYDKLNADEMKQLSSVTINQQQVQLKE